MGEVRVTVHGEPSDEAWRRSGEVAARILENLAERDARAAAVASAEQAAQPA